MKKEKSLTRRKGEPYPLEIRLAAIGEYRLGVHNVGAARLSYNAASELL